LFNKNKSKNNKK